MQNTMKPRLMLLAILAAYSVPQTVQAGDKITIDKVEVVSATPLPSVGVPVSQIPSNVQTVDAEDLERTQSLDISEYMKRHMGSVYVNEVQNNPLQPDINYRGFTASPLLGTPQGLSIYMDGVRMNQPFGDVVSWDLIPKNAIKGMQLMPGSNPMFGLNTLGGALSIQTKNGRDNPGGALQTLFGSWGRNVTNMEYGGVADNIDYFVAGTFFDENGWRDHSESNSKQLFGKLGWHGEKTDLNLTYAWADTDLNGNGMTPQSMLRRNYDSVFTWPDNTQNKSNFLNLQLAHYFTDNVSLTGNTYYRKIKTRSYNGDLNDGSLPEVVGAVTSPNWGQNVFLANGSPACASQLATGDEPLEKCSGLINRSEVNQENMGIFGQVNVSNKLWGLDNTYAVGTGFDFSRSTYKASSEYGVVTADRGIAGSGVFLDPTNGKGYNADGELDDARVNLRGRNYTWSIFATDTLAVTDKLHVTAAARYNHIRVKNKDRLDGDAYRDADDSLSGNHTFSRINPAIGLTYAVSDALNVYTGYNEGSRAPTSIELGCANPDNGCRLPNAMAGDPPLDQVVTKTWEAGLRGKLNSAISWNAGVFSATNYDDIQFISSPTSGEGYFKNFGETRRRGVEGGLNASLGNLAIGANYTFLDATYESNETFMAEANSSADDGNVNVKKGNRIPLVPRNMFKLYSNYRVTDRFSVGGDLLAVTGSYVRGNENNKHESGGVFLGGGKIAGYSTVNLSAAFQMNDEWNLFARINNVFDKEYATAGQLGASPFNPANGNYMTTNGRRSKTVGETFLAPGAPRSVWVGVRYEFGGKKSAYAPSAD
ncbi:TonB-dependent receptor [Methylotenera mobilis]|uniref:TonB-dependent receptor n=1 Tax=Methylotenera mobilis (strain JLW8 / ATCC BAA-1282 / DSM 17540) TaxID=583345 RepID=C6WSQ6_METML|nr:TonB-dependent receptor [Methylotenera mobilis]ACT47148.1 TonB-dependent receptor [Methylotenera mobilis JLW8]